MNREWTEGVAGTTMRWTALVAFLVVAVGTTTAIAAVCSAMGWTVQSPAWLLLVPFAMWAPAFAHLVVTRRIDAEHP